MTIKPAKCRLCGNTFNQRVGDRRQRETCSEECQRGLIALTKEFKSPELPAKQPRARQPRRRQESADVRAELISICHEPRNACQVTQIFNDRFYAQQIATLEEVEIALEQLTRQQDLEQIDNGWVAVGQEQGRQPRRLLEVAA